MSGWPDLGFVGLEAVAVQAKPSDSLPLAVDAGVDGLDVACRDVLANAKSLDVELSLRTRLMFL